MLDDEDRLLAAARSRLAGSTWNACELDPDVFGEALNGAASDRVERLAAVLLSINRPA